MSITMSPTDALVSRALCLAGIAISSRRLLTKWQAVQQLVPPVHLASPPAPVAPTPPPSESSPRVRWLSRVKRNKCAVFLPVFSVIVGIEFALSYLLPKYGTRLLLDIVWGSIEGLLFTLVFYTAINIAFPRPIELSYTRPKADGPYITHSKVITSPQDPFFAREPFRIAVSFLLTGASYAAASQGMYWALGLVSAGWILMMTSGMTFPRLRTKYLVAAMVGYIVACAGIFAVIFGGIKLYEHFYPSDPTSAPDALAENKGDDFATPSDWIMRVMVLFNDVWGFVLPTILIALNLRFDQRAYQAVPDNTRTSVIVPTVAPTIIRAPTFIASILLLAGGVAVADYLGQQGENWEILGLMSGIVITVPLICAGSAAVAWYHGELREWWAYTEEWVPPAPKAEDVANAVAAIDEKASNEGEQALEKEGRQTVVSAATMSLV